MLGTTDMTEISTACFRKLKEGSALEHLVHFNVILKVLAQSPLPRYVQVPFFFKKNISVSISQGTPLAATRRFDAALIPQTLVYLQHLSISLCTKSNLEQGAVYTESSLEYIEMQRDCIIGWKGNSK